MLSEASAQTSSSLPPITGQASTLAGGGGIFSEPDRSAPDSQVTDSTRLVASTLIGPSTVTMAITVTSVAATALRPPSQPARAAKAGYSATVRSTDQIMIGRNGLTSCSAQKQNRPSTASRTAQTPPEKSRNIEIGAKFELFEKRALLGVSAFYSEKFNERNTDPDVAAAQELLSGARHAAGMEFNLAGRFTPKWEIFVNHTWIPSAKIDKSNVALNAAGTGAQVQGDRPALTPRHSGSVWSTYALMPKLRVGAGLTYRSSQNPEGARHMTAAGFATVDAMAEYSFDDKTSLKLSVNNLADKLYADTLYRGFYGPGAARSVQLTLKTRF